MIVERALPFDHQLSCTIIDYHQLSFSLSLFKIFMIVDDSFSRLTTRMIVHDSFSVSCFPRKSAGSFKMAAKSCSRVSRGSSENSVDIDIPLSSLLFIHSLVLPLFHQRSPNSSSSNKLITSKQAAALFRRDKFILLQFVFYGKPFSIYIFTREEPGTSCSRDFARATAGKLSSTITIFFGRLTR